MKADDFELLHNLILLENIFTFYPNQKMNPRNLQLFSMLALVMLLLGVFTSVSCKPLAEDSHSRSVVTLEALAPSSDSTSYILQKDGRKLLVTIRGHRNIVANRKVRTPKNPYDKEGLRFRR